MGKIYSNKWQAMGTEIVILSPSIIPKYIISLLEDIFQKYENKYSRFKSSSDLSKLNKEKVLKLDRNFIEIFELSKKIHKETNGAFNPLLSVRSLGYKETYKNPGEIEEKKYNINFNSVEVKNGILRLEKDQEIDFGGIVKGWTVDKVSTFLLEKGIKDFLINAGGDIFASGKVSKTENWTVAIEKTGQVVELENQAIASSGKSKRFWKGSDGNFYHHILNKITKSSSKNELESISVLANTCVKADSWATASFSLGKIDGQNLLIDNGIKYFLNFGND